MSDSRKEDAAAGTTPGDAPKPKVAAPPKPPAKTVIGVGAPRPPAPPVPPPVPRPAASAVFAKPKAAPPPPRPAAVDALFELDTPDTAKFKKPPTASVAPVTPAAEPEPAVAEDASPRRSFDTIERLFGDNQATGEFSLPELFDTGTLRAIAPAVAEALAPAAQAPKTDGAPEATKAPAAPPAPQPVARSAALGPPEESLDRTLSIPKFGDSIEERRARLANRIKTARAAFKLLGYLDITDDERKEVIALFAEYEQRLRDAPATPQATAADPEKRDGDALHRALPKEAVDDLERIALRLEERMLAVDEFVPQSVARSRLTKDKHPPKLLLRYARLLASRRFNVGFRRDRFEDIVTDLLTVRAADGRLRLLPRDKARPVLLQLLTGLPTSGQDADREDAVAYLRESLDRLAEIKSHKELFDSGYFLDVHGYKISMREQATSPEFLYLSVAINVELHNRIEGFIAQLERQQKANQLSQQGPPREHLNSQLRAQEESVQAVFGGFRHTRERAATAAATAASSQARAHPVAPTKAKAAPKRSATKPAGGWLAIGDAWQRYKLVGASVAIVLSVGITLFTSGILRVEPPVRGLSRAEMHAISALLQSATVAGDGKSVQGMIDRRVWLQMTPLRRQLEAESIAKRLKRLGIEDGVLLAFKSKAIEIRGGTVVSVIDPPALR